MRPSASSRDARYYFMYKLREVYTALKMNITTEASKLMSEDQFDVRKASNLKMQFKHVMHFKGPYFAEMINLFVIFICLTFFRHHFLRKHAYLCLNWILRRVRRTLEISHLRPFNNNIYRLYRKSHSECKIIWIEKIPYFIKKTYAETLSDKQWTETTNRNRILFENVLSTRMQ